MSDRILGALAVLLAGSMAWAAYGYAAIISYEPVGPRAFPLLLAALLAVCGMWLIARPDHKHEFVAGPGMRRIALCGAAIFVYAALFQILGFVIATALMAIPVGRAFGGTWRQCATYGLSLAIVLFVLFDRLLDVVLPWGILQPLLTIGK